jgi:pimeloyl-ACP methyl ester carboxylesterase
VKVHYEKHSELASKPTLFIHGNLASSVWWEPLLKEWPKHGARGSAPLYFADWRGCGKNPPVTEGERFTLKDLAQDFLELLDEQKLPRVNLVGHSLGGLIALQMMILAPERVERAILLDSVGAEGVVFDDSMYEAFRQMALSRDLTKTVILSTIRGAEKLAPDFVERIADDAFKAVKGIGTSVLEILKTVNVLAEAAHVKTPVLLLHGREDAIIPLKDSETLARTLPHAKLEVLSEVGHCWNVENPSLFTRRVREWLS